MGQGLSKRRTVLIVEDDLDLLHLTTKLLEDEQLETIECESAEAALAIMLMRGRDIAMIFADVRLPGAMDGIDLAWEVRLRWPLLPWFSPPDIRANAQGICRWASALCPSPGNRSTCSSPPKRH